MAHSCTLAHSRRTRQCLGTQQAMLLPPATVMLQWSYAKMPLRSRPCTPRAGGSPTRCLDSSVAPLHVCWCKCACARLGGASTLVVPCGRLLSHPLLETSTICIFFAPCTHALSIESTWCSTCAGFNVRSVPGARARRGAARLLDPTVPHPVIRRVLGVPVTLFGVPVALPGVSVTLLGMPVALLGVPMAWPGLVGLWPCLVCL